MFIDRVSLPILPDRKRFMVQFEKFYDSYTLSNEGEWAQTFSNRLAALANTKYCILFNSASSALDSIVRYYKSQSFDVCPFTWATSLSPLARHKVDTRYFDLRAERPIPDYLQILSAEKDTTGVIMSTHTFGCIPDVEVINSLDDLAKPVIFDAAHAFGIEVNGRSILSYGTASVISLHATKGLTSGEGGAVLTSDHALAEFLEFISRPKLIDGRFHPEVNNFRMSELNALSE